MKPLFEPGDGDVRLPGVSERYYSADRINKHLQSLGIDAETPELFQKAVDALAKSIVRLAELERQLEEERNRVANAQYRVPPGFIMMHEDAIRKDRDRISELERMIEGAHVVKVINNNQPGWENIIETAPNVTLDVGKEYRLMQIEPIK